ncbi:MAG: NAD-dependent epimerase/dehydratase family protein [Isosphaeraceae bacterium]
MTSSDTRPAALVTGAAGFIGSHLVRELLRLGRVRVVALDDLSGGYRHNGADGAEFVEASVTDHATLALHPAVQLHEQRDRQHQPDQRVGPSRGRELRLHYSGLPSSCVRC